MSTATAASPTTATSPVTSTDAKAPTVSTAELAAAAFPATATTGLSAQTLATIRAIDDFYRRTDELYSQTAGRMGLADCAFDIIYALVAEDGLTQKRLCELAFSSKQTVHSSIKRLVANGVVTLRGDGPRSQRVFLTEAGRARYEEPIRAVLAAEGEAVAIFSDEEQRQLTGAMERYTQALEGRLASLTFR